MILEIILAFILGIIAGSFTGLFPGIHINLVAAGLLALIAGGYFSGIAPLVFVVFVVVMAITHTFIDFIPSVFLGAPEDESFIAVLPGHRMLMEGKGFEASVLVMRGALSALGIVLVFSFIFVKFLPHFFEFIQIGIPFILIFASVYLIFSEEKWISAGIIFLLAGILGWLTFNLPVKEPLLPLLSGLFGVSSLIVSVKSKVKLPRQRILKLRRIKLERKSFLKSIFAACIAGPMCSFLPGIGSGHAAVIGSEIIGNEKDNRAFLFLIGAINIVVMSLSFVTAYSIGKGRTGAAVAVQKILEEIKFSDLVVILVVIFFAAFAAFFLGVYFARIFARRINKFDYGKISIVVIGILFLVNIFLSNWLGVLVLITSTALGTFCIFSNVRRINLMGCLLLPTIIFYLTI